MKKEKSRIIASVSGLSGGILLLYGAILPIIMALGHSGKVSEIWQMRHLNLILLLFLAVIIFGIIGIIGAIKVKSKNKIAGVMMLISAFGGFISTYMLFGTLLAEIAFIFLLVAGIMAFRK